MLRIPPLPRRGAVVLLLAASVLASAAPLPVAATPDRCDAESLVADFLARDLLPQSPIQPGQWYARNWNNGWGPAAETYPPAAVPPGCDRVAWQRARLVAVARRYLGLPYRRHHIPAWDPPAVLAGADGAGAGLDCSNFTTWVYNYGLGVRFTSHVRDQAEGAKGPGRLLAPDEPFAPGDLLFILRGDRSSVSHVVMYLGDGRVIDSHGAYGGVTEHAMTGWYATHYSHARRVVE